MFIFRIQSSDQVAVVPAAQLARHNRRFVVAVVVPVVVVVVRTVGSVVVVPVVVVVVVRTGRRRWVVLGRQLLRRRSATTTAGDFADSRLRHRHRRYHLLSRYRPRTAVQWARNSVPTPTPSTYTPHRSDGKSCWTRCFVS